MSVYRTIGPLVIPTTVSCNLPKIHEKRPNLRVFCQKDADGIANSEDPDQTAPRSDCSSRSSLFWVCTVCPDLSVRKLWIITVLDIFPEIYFRYLCPPNQRGGGTYCFWFGSRRRLRCFVSVRYLLNRWTDFDQICTDTLLGGWNELIRFW